MRTLLTIGATAAFTIALGTAATPVAHAAPSTYTIELLPALAGGRTSEGFAINDAGDVAGVMVLDGRRSDIMWPATDRSHPVLITPDGYQPKGITDSGVVVGNMYIPDSAGYAWKYFWRDGKLSHLLFPSERTFQDVAANGTALDQDARLWTSPTSVTSLPRTGDGVAITGDQWEASAISRNANHVVGRATQGTTQIAIRWTNRRLSALPTIENFSGPRPTAVNDRGVSVGDATDQLGGTRPVMWDAQGRPSFLPKLPGLVYQRPLAINNDGVIVGRANIDDQDRVSEDGVLWRDGKVRNLNDLIVTPAGSKIIEAHDINSSGQIAGTIELSELNTRAFIATPKAVNVYTTPGTHHVNGRDWRTACETYSQTTRCRTEIIATEVKLVDGRYTHVKGWTFNNLTYLPSRRSLWNGNPLATPGNHTVAGRQWRTECDTAITGGNGCRSYILATRITATPTVAHNATYSQGNEWVFNSIVMFS